MNKVILVGRLSKDPELRTTQTGKSIASFSIAVQRRMKVEGQPDVDFFNCTAWGKQGETICQYLSKGNEISISGRLQNRSWQDRDGNNRISTEITVEEFDFIGSRGERQTTHQQKVNTKADDLNDPDFCLLSDEDDVPF